MKQKNIKNGFTLVELLAVIVILAIILVIAVPKIMSVIEDSKKATLESTAKMIASSAEKAKVQNTVLGKEEEITCDSVAKINSLDYDKCSIEFEDNVVKVSIVGKGKFAGLYVCSGTKTNATATNESCASVPYGDVDTYLTNLLAKESELHNGLVQTTATYNGTDYDAGIRYVGAMDEVKNQVYYNCDDTDANGVSYGGKNYDYANSCEVWRIIGVFDTKSSTSGTSVKRVKLINTNSTFRAVWDSSASSGDNAANSGKGINQWGPSGEYKGADLMQLLNGYYISTENSTCTYCMSSGKETCLYSCTAESLKSANMKVLTSTAKGMIENAVWDTYGVKWPNDGDTTYNFASTAYLEEKGISQQYTGKSLCVAKGGGDYCNDSVERTTSWTGLVGLMSVSDITYANGWLYNQSETSLDSWTISPDAYTYHADDVWCVSGDYASSCEASYWKGVFASVYLKSNIQIISGNGNDKPYILAI